MYERLGVSSDRLDDRDGWPGLEMAILLVLHAVWCVASLILGPLWLAARHHHRADENNPEPGNPS
jgi:hypothetical protein